MIAFSETATTVPTGVAVFSAAVNDPPEVITKGPTSVTVTAMLCVVVKAPSEA